MDQNCLIAEYTNERDFQIAIEVLEKAHYTQEEVSIVKHADDSRLAEIEEAEDKTPTAMSGEKTAAAGTIAGGTLGAALGTMTLIGPLLVAGPLLGMAAGAVGGGLVGTVNSWGVDDEVAKTYEAKVRDGSMLLIVTTNDLRLKGAEQILKTTGPESLEMYHR